MARTRTTPVSGRTTHPGVENGTERREHAGPAGTGSGRLRSLWLIVMSLGWLVCRIVLGVRGGYGLLGGERLADPPVPPRGIWRKRWRGSWGPILQRSPPRYRTQTQVMLH